MSEKKQAKGGVEYRAFPLAEIRAEGDEKPRIVGHAAVFGQRTELYPGLFEVVAAGAFKKTIQEADVRALFNHDPNFVLGRNKSGTLSMREDDAGLAIEAVPPDTQTVRDLVLEPMRRGDISQMSFAFRVVRQKWEENIEKNELTRVLEEVRLYDVSVVTYPAYPQTDASLRSMLLDDDSGIDLYAVRFALAKRQHGFTLSTEDEATLKQTIEVLSRNAAAPEVVAAHHPAEEPQQPPIDMETLRRRLVLAKHPKWS
jgi:HK97 family phage prohead protease